MTRATRAFLAARERGFTLVEMIVVMAIILIIAAMVVLFVPLFTDRNKMSNAAERLQGWLLIAKQRAKRDGVPTGIRLYADPNNVALVRKAAYIQQPEPLSGGRCLGEQFGLIAFDSDVDFLGAATDGSQPEALVQPGDYLELYGGGGVLRILTVASKNQLFLEEQTVSPQATGNYRIFRQPRRLLGEDELNFPQDIILDFGVPPNNPFQSLQPINNTHYDVLFSPKGDLVGQGAGTDKICLWIRDETLPTAFDGGPLLVTVQVRTGFISVYPVAPPPADSYEYTREGRSSGM